MSSKIKVKFRFRYLKHKKLDVFDKIIDKEPNQWYSLIRLETSSLKQNQIRRDEMKKNILIVEDDLKAAKSAEKFFSDKYSCFIAQDLQEALDLLSENVFDYVITDTFYPQETGSGKKDYVHRMIKDVLAQIESGVKNGNLTEEASAKASVVINEWANPDEFIQPLGLWLIKILLDCHYKINQLVMTTNLNHHAELFEPIWCSKVSYSRKFPLKLSSGGFQRSGWPFLQECVNDPDGTFNLLLQHLH